MNISYCILTHNEKTIKDLLFRLKNYKLEDDEICVVDDYSTNESVTTLLKVMSELGDIKYIQNHLNKDFAQQKNICNSLATKPWIFNVDADEMIPIRLIKQLNYIIEVNDKKGIEAIWVPRVNIVKGITDEHINKWSWNINKRGYINFPDWQLRLYKNSKSIYWKGKVHEQLVGYKKFAKLPTNRPEDLAIHHVKDIKRQEDQNKFYEEIIGE